MRRYPIVGFSVSDFDGDVVGDDRREMGVMVSCRAAERDGQVESVRSVGDLERAGYPSHARADLDDVGGSVVEIRQEVAESIEVLASADRRPHSVGDAPQS